MLQKAWRERSRQAVRGSCGAGGTVCLFDLDLDEEARDFTEDRAEEDAAENVRQAIHA